MNHISSGVSAIRRVDETAVLILHLIADAKIETMEYKTNASNTSSAEWRVGK